MSITGESLLQTEQTARELDSLERRAQVAALHLVVCIACEDTLCADLSDRSVCVLKEEMSRSQVLILHGHQLAAGHHYAMALIIQRCNELRHQCDNLTSALSIKRNMLVKAHTLLRHLKEVESITFSFNLHLKHTQCVYDIPKPVFFCYLSFRPSTGVMMGLISWPISRWINFSLKRVHRLLFEILRCSRRGRHLSSLQALMCSFWSMNLCSLPICR